MSQVTISSNCFFLLQLRGQYLKPELTKATMEMKSNKTEILGAVKLDYIHMETCVFLITRTDWIFYLQKERTWIPSFLFNHKPSKQSSRVHSPPFLSFVIVWRRRNLGINKNWKKQNQQVKVNLLIATQINFCFLYLLCKRFMFTI